jgi:hypothetical protein
MAGLYGLAGSDDCAQSDVFVTVRYMVWLDSSGNIERTIAFDEADRKM